MNNIGISVKTILWDNIYKKIDKPTKQKILDSVSGGVSFNAWFNLESKIHSIISDNITDIIKTESIL